MFERVESLIGIDNLNKIRNKLFISKNKYNIDISPNKDERNNLYFKVFNFNTYDVNKRSK